jgi:hypothetical protein
VQPKPRLVSRLLRLRVLVLFLDDSSCNSEENVSCQSNVHERLLSDLMQFALSALKRGLRLNSSGLLNFHCHVVICFINIFNLLRFALSVFLKVKYRRHLKDVNGTIVVTWENLHQQNGCEATRALREIPHDSEVDSIGWISKFVMLCETLKL